MSEDIGMTKVLALIRPNAARKSPPVWRRGHQSARPIARPSAWLGAPRPFPRRPAASADHWRESGSCSGRSVLKISGLPYCASASSSASKQKSAASVFDSRHASTARLTQSMITTR